MHHDVTPDDEPPPSLFLLPFSFNDTHHRLPRDFKQTLTKILEDVIYNSTFLVIFEPHPEDIHRSSLIAHSTSLIREHNDYCHFLYFYLFLTATQNEPFFQYFSLLPLSQLAPSVNVFTLLTFPVM